MSLTNKEAMQEILDIIGDIKEYWAYSEGYDELHERISPSSIEELIKAYDIYIEGLK